MQMADLWLFVLELLTMPLRSCAGFCGLTRPAVTQRQRRVTSAAVNINKLTELRSLRTQSQTINEEEETGCYMKSAIARRLAPTSLNLDTLDGKLPSGKR